MQHFQLCSVKNTYENSNHHTKHHQFLGCYQGQKTFCGSRWRWTSERKAWPIFRLNQCCQFKPASTVCLQNRQWSYSLSICFNNNNKTKAFHIYGCKGQYILQHCIVIQLQQWIKMNTLFILVMCSWFIWVMVRPLVQKKRTTYLLVLYFWNN